MNSEQLLKGRLATIKYLFNLGVEQANGSEYSSGFSILAFHDSIEMYLKLLAEVKNINSQKFSFIEYWNKIPNLQLKEAMRVLNTRRVNLKHKGIFPSKQDLQISKITTEQFFRENTIVQFNIEWSDISRTITVENPKIKSYIEKAELELGKENYRDSIENITIAFHLMIRFYEKKKLDAFGTSPFEFRDTLNQINTPSITTKRNLASFMRKVNSNFKVMRDSLRIISLGIDYKKYLKFKLLTPVATFVKDNDKPVLELTEGKVWNKPNCQFCINFVLDVVHKLQEFDFEIESLVSNDLILEIDSDEL